jgi:hypothetical protein
MLGQNQAQFHVFQTFVVMAKQNFLFWWQTALLQVNSGVLSVCTAFLSGEPAARLSLQELQQLIAALLEFMAVCKRAIRVHFRLIGEEGQDFHTQLLNGFQSLTALLSHYIPAILVCFLDSI